MRGALRVRLKFTLKESYRYFYIRFPALLLSSPVFQDRFYLELPRGSGASAGSDLMSFQENVVRDRLESVIIQNYS